MTNKKNSPHYVNSGDSEEPSASVKSVDTATVGISEDIGQAGKSPSAYEIRFREWKEANVSPTVRESLILSSWED